MRRSLWQHRSLPTYPAQLDAQLSQWNSRSPCTRASSSPPSASSLQLPDLGVELPADGEVHVVAHFSEMELQLYVPNAFSPNNDGVNDAFRPLGQAFGAQDYRFQVFNRWGEVVFSSVDPDEAWLGQDQRADGLHYVKDGSYAWSVQVRWTHGNYPEQFSGTLILMSPTAIAVASPPPMHSAAMPRFLPRRSSA